MFRAIILCLMLLCLCGVATATDVFGPVSGTWTLSGSPYNVIREINIPHYQTLTIQPGVQVIFQGYYKFIVNQGATLQAIGTVQDSILFTAADTSVGWHGIRFLASNDSSILSYCKIKYGKATGASEEDNFGGGVYSIESSPRIANSLIEKCSAVWYGGAIYCGSNSGTQIIENTIRNNIAYDGGGITCSCGSTTVIISNNLVENNQASHNGGGIVCRYSQLIISHNIIQNNESNAFGGGIDVHGGNAFLLKNTICNNTARVGGGGGIYGYAAVEIRVDSSDIFGNMAGDWGGGILILAAYYDSVSMISNSSIHGNTSSSNGGGIFFHYSNSCSVINCVLFDNIAGVDGGGIACWNSAPQLTNCTIVNNHALSNGGGIKTLGPYITNVSNAIIWNNSPQQIQMENIGTVVASYSLIQGGWSGIGNINANPLFVTGPEGNYYLSQIVAGQTQNSPCVDAGNPSSVMITGTTRTDRFQDFGIIDMGYHYLNEIPIPPPTMQVTIAPVSPPIIIPAQGGWFFYDINARNYGDSTQTFYVWNRFKLPNGTMSEPVMGPVTRTFPAGYHPTRTYPQSVAGTMPAGSYLYLSYVGTYPWVISDSSYFSFTKTALSDGGEWIAETTCSGDFFDEYEGTNEQGVQLNAPTPPTATDLHLSVGPNPFNPTTTIRFDLPQAERVTLEVFDIGGRMVEQPSVAVAAGGRQGRLPHQQWFTAGTHEIQFDGSSLPSGIYIYHLTAGSQQASGKMVLLK